MSLLYSIFRQYASTVIHAYFPKFYCIGKENIPTDAAVILVGNHQNCLVDPMCVEIAVNDRKVHSLVRQDIFGVNAFVSKFLNGIGLIPITRTRDLKEGSKTNVREANQASFNEVDENLIAGHTLLIFPEGGNQNKRWLGYLSLGYLAMAFHAAEQSGFSKEIYIQPFGHHYENYFHPFYGFLLQFGKPIALSAYYELYKTKPRTAMRQVNELVEQQISSLMLNIRDLDHYEAIDDIRTSVLCKEFADKHNLRADYMPEKLQAEQQLVSVLEANEAQKPALDELQAVETEMASKQLCRSVLEKQPTMGTLLCMCLLLTILLPLYVPSIAITWIAFLLPYILGKSKPNGDIDRMWQSTWNIGTFAIIAIPFMWLLPVIVLLFTSPLWAWIYCVAFPIMIRFCIFYHKMVRKTVAIARFVNNAEAKQIADKRNEILNNINKIIEYGK